MIGTGGARRAGTIAALIGMLMIAACGHFRLAADGPTPLDSGINPGLQI